MTRPLRYWLQAHAVIVATPSGPLVLEASQDPGGNRPDYVQHGVASNVAVAWMRHGELFFRQGARMRRVPKARGAPPLLRGR